MIDLIRKTVTAATVASMVFCGLSATSFAAPPQPEPVDIFELSIGDNLATPAIPQKKKEAVRRAVNEFAKKIAETGLKTSLVRDGEVVEVTIPCSALFAPNSIELKSSATAKLNPLVKYVLRKDLYKVLIAVHSDNTGDETYCENLTADRANSIDEFFYRANGNSDTGCVPYGLGADEPAGANNSMRSRDKNRRVEIYFVPTESFISRTK